MPDRTEVNVEVGQFRFEVGDWVSGVYRGGAESLNLIRLLRVVPREFHGRYYRYSVTKARRTSSMCLCMSCSGLLLFDDSSGGCGDLRPMRGFISRDEVVHEAYDAGSIAHKMIQNRSRKRPSIRRDRRALLGDVHDRGLRSSCKCGKRSRTHVRQVTQLG